VSSDQDECGAHVHIANIVGEKGKPKSMTVSRKSKSLSKSKEILLINISATGLNVIPKRSVIQTKNHF
jgi:hypothetical protein